MVASESVNSNEFHWIHCFCGFSCHVLDSSGPYKLLSFLSERFPKFVLMFGSGSLLLFLSVTGWRIFDYIWGIHQYDHRKWSDHAMNQLSLGGYAGVIPVDFWKFPLHQTSAWTLKCSPFQSSLSVLSSFI